MARLNEAEKRDFISQMILLVEQEKNRLMDNGYDATAKMNALKVKKKESDSSEIAQQEAAARAKEATKRSNDKLNDAYREASNFADILSGLLGRDDELIKRMRKFRK